MSAEPTLYAEYVAVFEKGDRGGMPDGECDRLCLRLLGDRREACGNSNAYNRWSAVQSHGGACALDAGPQPNDRRSAAKPNCRSRAHGCGRPA